MHSPLKLINHMTNPVLSPSAQVLNYKAVFSS